MAATMLEHPATVIELQIPEPTLNILTQTQSTLNVKNLVEVFNMDRTTEIVHALKSDLDNGSISLGMYYLAIYQMTAFADSMASTAPCQQSRLIEELDSKAGDTFKNRRIVFDCLMNGAHNQLFGIDLPWFSDSYEGECKTEVIYLSFLKENGIQVNLTEAFAK